MGVGVPLPQSTSGSGSSNRVTYSPFAQHKLKLGGKSTRKKLEQTFSSNTDYEFQNYVSFLVANQARIIRIMQRMHRQHN